MERLIDKLYNGVTRGEIQQPFTMDEFKSWMDNHGVTKDDGTSYSESAVNSLLSNSAKHNKGSTNLNEKLLSANRNAHDKQIYWFDGIEE